ncbi:unnamed protein product [Cylicocyclus nassatus]|uniref:Secreted protein n=1 Tax=Cylicocyclus nassatus TaxID=53992 RepID=A0AA36M6G6_CYLNA|nr:unnamed protein product [Cylicocyclus nassatus]
MKLPSAFLLLSIAVTIHGYHYEYRIWCMEACRHYRTQPDWTQKINIEKIAKIDCYPIGYAKTVLHIETFCQFFYSTRRSNPGYIQFLEKVTWQQWCRQQGCEK